MNSRELCIGILFLLAFATVAPAQENLILEGRVEDPTRAVVSGATVELASSDGSYLETMVTDAHGAFRFEGLSAGAYVLVATSAGFARLERSVRVTESQSVTLRLDLATFAQEVVVSAAMPEFTMLVEVRGDRLSDQIAQDAGEFLREQPEMFSWRRGAINMDPTVRGLQESEVAMFVDGTRTIAAGPARMDSDISHVSPHAVQSIQVVKGPYALTWGAGALSAVQLETFRPEFRSGGFDASGRLGYNYGENGNTSDAYVMAWGSNERFRFTASHNTRLGDDYTDGDGNTVEAGYKSFDTRWDFGFLLNPETTFEYSGGYQEQRDLDYPGRILDATFFKTQSHAVDLVWDRADLGQFRAQFFANLKDHLMNNDNKPTATIRGLDIALPAESDTYGGRAFFARDRGNVTWKAGFDFYSANQNATRTISRRDTGMTMFEDIVWPDAQINDLGAYGQVIYSKGRGQIGGTLRIDGVDASAGEVSDFFRENTEGDLDKSETNVSAAVNANYRLTDDWFLSAGFGRAVRTANTLERYSDRFPAVKFQNAAEFLGSPELSPERSLEWNVGTSLLVSQATFGFDIFGRYMDDYITVVPDPEVPPRLPLSPGTVYRYINGEARFWGYEAHGNSPIGDYVVLRGSLSYVWAEDKTFDEPAFGIPPLKFIAAGRVKTADGRCWVELEVTAAAEQDRVATTRFEMPTEGWQKLDLRAGFALVSGLDLRVGLLNLTDEQYVTHLNSANPFTMARIAEPGRSFYVGLDYGF